MKIESIDPATFDVRASCERDEGWRLPMGLAGLIMAAMDCGVSSIACSLPERLRASVRTAAERLVERNPIITLAPPIAGYADSIEPRSYVVGKGDTFFCIGYVHTNLRYSIFLAGTEDNVDLASRFAHILSTSLGHSNDFSFEVRLSVYELLMNVVEHGIESSSRDWIQVDLKREGDALLVSIIDQGVAFDPSGNQEFDLLGYIEARKTRGLGLVMTRRIAEEITHRRESGYNRTLMKKTVRSGGALPRDGKEQSMAQFEITGPLPHGDGSNWVTLGGDLDAKGALLVEQMLAQLLEKKIFRVTLDFEKVSFISSAGVGILLGLVSSLRDGGGDALFTKVPPKVSSVFRLLNLEDYFTIEDTIAAES
jgi:anti-anti-sigma factor